MGSVVISNEERSGISRKLTLFGNVSEIAHDFHPPFRLFFVHSLETPQIDLASITKTDSPVDLESIDGSCTSPAHPSLEQMTFFIEMGVKTFDVHRGRSFYTRGEKRENEEQGQRKRGLCTTSFKLLLF